MFDVGTKQDVDLRNAINNQWLYGERDGFDSVVIRELSYTIYSRKSVPSSKVWHNQ